MNLPSYQPKKPPEGQYVFKIVKDVDKDRKHGPQGDFISITFYFKIQSPDGGIRDFRESILPWDDRYRDILLALGGEEDERGDVHLSDMIDIIGKKFIARIKHVPDKDDPRKTWARITDIEVDRDRGSDEEDVPPPANGEYEEPSDDEVPF